MRLKIIILAILLAGSGCSTGHGGDNSPEHVRKDILINDFENQGYGDWTVTGQAFGV